MARAKVVSFAIIAKVSCHSPPGKEDVVKEIFLCRDDSPEESQDIQSIYIFI